MDKKEVVSIGLIFIGIVIMILGCNDILSISVDILNNLFNLNIDAVFLSSFTFRIIVVLIGGMCSLVGGMIFKIKYNK